MRQNARVSGWKFGISDSAATPTPPATRCTSQWLHISMRMPSLACVKSQNPRRPSGSVPTRAGVRRVPGGREPHHGVFSTQRGDHACTMHILEQGLLPNPRSFWFWQFWPHAASSNLQRAQAQGAGRQLLLRRVHGGAPGSRDAAVWAFAGQGVLGAGDSHHAAGARSASAVLPHVPRPCAQAAAVRHREHKRRRGGALPEEVRTRPAVGSHRWQDEPLRAV
jgi:hypothetical protein